MRKPKNNILFIVLLILNFSVLKSHCIRCLWEYLDEAIFENVEEPPAKENITTKDGVPHSPDDSKYGDSHEKQKNIVNIYLTPMAKDHIISPVTSALPVEPELKPKDTHSTFETHSFHRPTNEASSQVDINLTMNFEKSITDTGPSNFLGYNFNISPEHCLFIALFCSIFLVVELISLMKLAYFKWNIEKVVDDILPIFTKDQDPIRRTRDYDQVVQRNENDSTRNALPDVSKWTAEDFFRYLKQLKTEASSEFDRMEGPDYVTDDFLREIARFVVKQECLSQSLELLTPQQLSRVGRFYHLNIRGTGDGREKDVNINVGVHVQGRNTTTVEKIKMSQLH